MFTESDFEYAADNTQVVLSPRQRIQTYGDTAFNFTVVTELMDEVNKIRVRDGRIDAQRPAIITPESCAKLLLDGFGDAASDFASWIRENPTRFAFVRYGFQVRKALLREEIIQDSIDSVLDRVKERASRDESGLNAVIRSVDDSWEVGLLKFTLDLIQTSAAGNVTDLRQRGLL
jgi:hypothetical protein